MLELVVDSLTNCSWVSLCCCDVSSPVCCAINPFCLLESPFFSFEFLVASMLWPWKGSPMKTQRRILDNRLYYTRKIELHRKGKKFRTVRITPILICGMSCSSHLTGKYGTRAFLGGSGRRAIAHTRPEFAKNTLGPFGIPLVRGASGAGQ